MKVLYQSCLATLILAVILCGIYPALVTVAGKLLFAEKANGGLISNHEGNVIGAEIIGQSFSKPIYFHGRPSAAGDKGYDAANSSGTNLGPTNQKLIDGISKNIDDLLKDNPSLKKGQIPTDLVTASASGLDPHISPEAAYVQVERVASARGVSVDEIRNLAKEHIEGPAWGLFGEPVVNVLLLNLDLDRRYPPKG
ncbi:MAG: kdpC 2 [Bacteriovoracaceae bacterium]|nr:kdpC 2 [Bacteriovoracaceae bacterium]